MPLLDVCRKRAELVAEELEKYTPIGQRRQISYRIDRLRNIQGNARKPGLPR